MVYRVAGELPSLQLKMSIEKYERIMNLVDKITGGPAAPSAVAPVPALPSTVPASHTISPLHTEVVVIDAEEQARKYERLIYIYIYNYYCKLLTPCSAKEQRDPAYQKLVVAHKQVEASFKIVSVSVALTRNVPTGESNIVKVSSCFYAENNFNLIL